MRGPYRRALLKLSGEALAGERGYGLDYKVVDGFADQLLTVHARGLQLSLVVGVLALGAGCRAGNRSRARVHGGRPGG